MKKQLVLAGFLILSGVAFAQNSNPWPTSGTVEINGSGTVTNPTNNLEVYNGSAANHVAILGTSPVLKFVQGPTNPTGLPPWSTNWCRIAMATGSMQFLQNAVAGDMIIENLGTASPIIGNGRSILFSTHFENGNGVEHMRLNEYGNLGIGTSNPSCRLHVVTPTVLSTPSSNAANTSVFEMSTTASGDYSAVKGISTGNNVPGVGHITGLRGEAVGNNIQQWATIAGVSGLATGGYNSFGGYFNATANQSSWRVVGLYATVVNGVGHGNAWAAWFDGDMQVNGLAYCTNSVWSSDRRFKTNITPLTSATDKLLKLNAYSYNYKTEEFKNKNFTPGKHLGLIAQELQEVFPELVTKDPEGYNYVNYIEMIPVLVEAFKENAKTNAIQQQQIEEQKQVIAELKKKMGVSEEIDQMNNSIGSSMDQNGPNPFTGETVIRYTLPAQTNTASLLVYDLTGKQIASFPIAAMGSSSVTITSEKLAAGMYIYSIVADGKIMDSKRMVVAGK